MSLAPLIVRELREQSRRPFNHALRMLGAAALLATTVHLLVRPAMAMGGTWYRLASGAPDASGTAFMTLLGELFQQFEHRGGALFAAMNLTMVGAIWSLGPLLTADCLSRERRDGTLGLLFLTPLRPRHIVLAKYAAHGLRAASVWLGAVPVLMLPLLLGGVSWIDALRALLLNASALVLALAAGLYASTLWQGHRAVLIGAFLVAALCAVAWLCAWTVAKSWPAILVNPEFNLVATLEGAVRRVVQTLGAMLSGSLFGPRAAWMAPIGGRAGGPSQLAVPAFTLALATAMAALVIVSASRHVARVQQEGRPAGRTAALAAWLGHPRFLQAWWRRQQRRMLRWSPVLWTELRTWRLRVAPWLILLAMVFVELWWMDYSMEWNPGFLEIPRLALASLAVITAAAAFQADRNSGTLELVLTTPGGARNLARGKLGSLGLQLAPGALLAVGIEAALTLRLGGERPMWLGTLAVGMVSQVVLAACVGAYWSLRLRSYVAALAATGLTLAVASWGGELVQIGVTPSEIMNSYYRYNLSTPWAWFPGRLARSAAEAALAIRFVILLHRALALRRFAAR